MLCCVVGEGVPRSILPDHEGRADYHGQSINMAARFMDKGARGGQIACTRELAEHVLAVWAAGGRSSPNGLHPGTHSIAEDDTGTLTDTAGVAARGAAGGTPPSSSSGSRGVSTGVLQPLDIELPSEQAAAVAAAAAVVVGASTHTTSSSGSGPGSAVLQTTLQQQPHRNSSSSNVGSGSRFIWSSSKAPAAADAQQQLSPEGRLPNSGPLSTPFAKLKLCSSNAAAAPAEASASINDLIIVSDDAAAAACSTTWAVQSADAEEVNSCPDGAQLVELQGAHTGSGAGGAAAAAGSGPTAQGSNGASGSQVRPSLARTAGDSWPGGSTGGQQPAKLRAQPQHKGLPGLAAQLWLSHSRTSEGSSHMQRGPPSRLNILTSPRSAQARSASTAVQQGLLSPNPTAPPAAPVVAPSPFVLAGVERVPLRVEVHRLGLFRFKGGPSVQEMVQILPTHLLGRAEFLAADAAAPASRKGQVGLYECRQGLATYGIPGLHARGGIRMSVWPLLSDVLGITSGFTHVCTLTHHR